MNRRTKIYVGFVVGVIALPLIAFATVRYVETNMAQLPYYGDNFEQIEAGDARKVASFEFINQDGHQLNGDFVEGKVWVACYFFTTCPTICPRMIAGMGDIQREFSSEDRVRLVSFTVDPLNDTPEVLKWYAEDRAIGTQQWSLVTGEKKDLYRYARKELTLMATDGDGGPQDFIHSDRLVLLDQMNYIRGYYDGTELSEINQLIVDIKKLLKEDLK